MKKAPSRHTWEEAVQRWLREKPRQPSDLQDHSRIQFLNKYLAGRYLDEIDTDLIEVIIRDMTKLKKNSTINRDLVPLKVILRRSALLWGWINRPPYIRVLPDGEGRTRWLKPEEAKALLAELPSHTRHMAIFSLATGLRASNVSNLEWSQIDLDRKCCWFHADQMKNRQAIAVPLTDTALAVLRERRGIHPVHVFTYRGSRIRKVTNRSWREACKRAGITGRVTFHTMRHSWASWHIQSGTRELELQALGGWKSLKMVQRYAHFGSEHLSKTARNCDSMLSRIQTQPTEIKVENSGAGNEARTRDLNLGKVVEITDGTD